MQWVLLTILGLLSFSVQATTLNIATGDYQPFTDASKPNQGSLVAYTEEIFKQLGYQAKHEFMPWKRALTEPLESKRFNQAIKNQPFSMPNNHWRTSISQKNHKEILGCNKNFIMSCYALRFETQE